MEQSRPALPSARHMKLHAPRRQKSDASAPEVVRNSLDEATHVVGIQRKESLSSSHPEKAYQRKRAIAVTIIYLVGIAVPALAVGLLILG